MAGPFGGLGPQGFVNSIYGPLQQQASQQQQARVQTLNSLVGSIMGALKAPTPDAYGAAAQDQTAAAKAAADRLAASSPDAQTQAMLQAINAPQSQQQQVSRQNQTVFGGNAALDQYMGGAVPAGVFAADQAAHQTYMDSLPALLGLAAQRGLGTLDLLASKENAQLGSEKATALQNARSTLADYLVKNQSNKISQAAIIGNLLGMLPGSASAPGLLGNTQPIGTIAGRKTGIEQQNADTSSKRLTIEQQNANTTAARAKTYATTAATNAATKSAAAAAARGRRGLSAKDYQHYTALANGAARTYHGVWKDKNNKDQQPLTWQQYLTHGAATGVPSWILVQEGRKVYSAAERSQGLIPGAKK